MSSRFQPFGSSSLRTGGLRRLKTAFSPSSSASSNRSFKWSSGQSTPSRSPSAASIATSSPLSSHMGSPNMGADCCETMEGLVPVCTTFSMDVTSVAAVAPEQSYRRSSVQKQQQQNSRSRLRSMLLRRRRQQSSWDLTIEEEHKTFGPAVRVFEPRQQGQIAMGSIFEVLEGKC